MKSHAMKIKQNKTGNIFSYLYHDVSFQKLRWLQRDAQSVSVAWADVTESRTGSVKARKHRLLCESLNRKSVHFFPEGHNTINSLDPR